mmetsp:Transcript_15925/g.18913  ORF Transcript_15925/g.18913 Transcript_15925/m.18913 type:complete len:238 (-) Transcript_15925:162-875(-)
MAPATIGEVIPGAGLSDVALGLDSPEDGSDLLLGSTIISHLLEGERALLVERPVPQQDLQDGCLQVHGVVVDEAVAVGDQVSGLLHSELDTVRLHLLVVHLQFLQARHDLSWHLRLREFAHPMEAVIAQNRHNTRDDLALDASKAAIADPVVENLIVEEKLSDDKVCAGVNLLLEVADVILARGRLQVHFGVARDADAEKVAIFLAYKFNEVRCVVEAVFNGNPVCGSARGVSSEGE